MNIGIFQGETQYFEFTVVGSDGAAVDLSVAEMMFSVKKGTEEVEVTPSKTDNVITAKLTAAQTASMIGTYEFELKIKDSNGDVDVPSNGRGTIVVNRSVTPVFV